MRIALLICYLFFGVAHASTLIDQEGLGNNTIKHPQVKKLPTTDYTSRLIFIEKQIKQSENKHQELKEVYAQLISKLDSNSYSTKNDEANIIDISEQLTALFKKYDELKLSHSHLTQDDKGMSFAAWAGVLLACVAVIVTGLGVVIALLALWGYSNIKQAATIAAVKKSEKSIEEAIDSGQFNELIYTAVNRAIYRGVLSEDDFPESDLEGETDESL